MTASPDHPPPARIRRSLRAVSSLHARGRGRVEIDLRGTGRLMLERGRFDDFCFVGEGRPRHLSGSCVHLTNAHGRVVLEGETLEIEYAGGLIDVRLTGTFDVALQGRLPPPEGGTAVA